MPPQQRHPAGHDEWQGPHGGYPSSPAVSAESRYRRQEEALYQEEYANPGWDFHGPRTDSPRRGQSGSPSEGRPEVGAPAAGLASQYAGPRNPAAPAATRPTPLSPLARITHAAFPPPRSARPEVGVPQALPVNPAVRETAPTARVRPPLPPSLRIGIPQARPGSRVDPTSNRPSSVGDQSPVSPLGSAPSRVSGEWSDSPVSPLETSARQSRDAREPRPVARRNPVAGAPAGALTSPTPARRGGSSQGGPPPDLRSFYAQQSTHRRGPTGS